MNSDANSIATMKTVSMMIIRTMNANLNEKIRITIIMKTIANNDNYSNK